MAGVSESLAGRAAIFQLLPLSLTETPKVTPFLGGYPEVLARPASRDLWYASYVQTYLERDVRAITQVRDLATYRRFLGLLASRHGQILNKSDLAAPLGVSIPTIGEWLRILEITGQVLVVPPYFENFGKRLLKSPKIYVTDSGLACHLLGIRSPAELERSPFLGAVIEGFVASEIVKAMLNRGARCELYFFRDRAGLEVDFLFPLETQLWMVEAKAARTIRSGDAAQLASLKPGAAHRQVQRVVVHRTPQHDAPTRVVVPGVRSATIKEFADQLNS